MCAIIGEITLDRDGPWRNAENNSGADTGLPRIRFDFGLISGARVDDVDDPQQAPSARRALVCFDGRHARKHSTSKAFGEPRSDSAPALTGGARKQKEV